MTKKAFFGILVACSFVLNAVVIGMWTTHALPRSFEKRKCGAMDNGCGKCPMQKSLGMSDSQWSRLKPLVSAYHESTAVAYKQIAESRMMLVDELEKAEPDSAVLRQCRERILDGQNAMQRIVTNHIIDEKELLTPDQRRRFFQLMRGNLGCSNMPGMMGVMPPECRKQNTAEMPCGHKKD
jgi:hypothetical protein